MPVQIKTYYKTTPIDDETLSKAIASAKDQENKVYQLFKKFSCMTNWDVYEVYNELIGPILPSSVGRSIDTLKKQNIIYGIGTIPGENGRPVTLYELNNVLPEVVDRKYSNELPKSIRLDLVLDKDGNIDTEKIVENLDLVLSKLSRKFKIDY